MKPMYTVRLTGSLAPDERKRVAQRVAGAAEIDADKLERLLARGEGRDLIKPSASNVANRLVTVLAEAGAPVRLVPVSEGVPGSTPEPRAASGTPQEPAPAAEPTGRAAARAPETPRASETPRAPETPEAVERPVDREDVADHAEAGAPSDASPGAGARERTGTSERPGAHGSSTEPVPESEPETEAGRSEGSERASRSNGEPASVAGPVPAPAPSPIPAPGLEDDADSAAAPSRGRRPEREPAPQDPSAEGRRKSGARAGERAAASGRSNAILGAVGAAVLAIGAVLAMDILPGPILVAVLVLAGLALLLAIVGQRRAMWLPGSGSLALLIWAIAGADAGIMATLAENWEWFVMLAGSLLILVAGLQEAQRGRGP